MEQTPSSPGQSPELPSVSLSPDREGGNILPNPEKHNDGLLEHQEQRGGSATVEQVSAPPIPVVAVPVVPAPLGDDTDAAAQTIVSLPTVASDDDLIEKEWVDKAKKVLAETKDDPYRREQEVTRLQADYLMKRYGRKLGSLQ